MSNEQVNVRVPTEARDAFLDLARMLRDDRKVLPRLRAFIREQSDPSAGSTTLSMRVEELEKDMRVVKDRLKVASAPARADDTQTDLEDLLGSRQAAPAPTPDPSWWNDAKDTARKMTAAGVAEMERRILAGQTPPQIAKAMGCAPNTVKNRMKSMGLQGPTGSFSQPDMGTEEAVAFAARLRARFPIMRMMEAAGFSDLGAFSNAFREMEQFGRPMSGKAMEGLARLDAEPSEKPAEHPSEG